MSCNDTTSTATGHSTGCGSMGLIPAKSRKQLFARGVLSSEVGQKPIRFLGHAAKRSIDGFAALHGGTPPSALNVTDATREFLLLKVIHRQNDNISTNTQSDHGRETQRLTFRFHNDAPIVEGCGHKNLMNVAEFGHPSLVTQLIAANVRHCRRGTTL